MDVHLGFYLLSGHS